MRIRVVVGPGVGCGRRGTRVGAANAQNAAGYLQQQYNAYYAQCMAYRRYPPPPYSAPAYGPAQGYPPSPNYASSGSSSYGSTNDLNRQELNRLNGPPAYPAPHY
jgi:hypothetical protein